MLLVIILNYKNNMPFMESVPAILKPWFKTGFSNNLFLILKSQEKDAIWIVMEPTPAILKPGLN